MGYTPHVLVVGGGALGTAIARDLAIRGLDATLVERGTLASGPTGRMHGILYAGARVPDDRGLARHVLRENRTLKDIAGHCVEPTGTLFLARDDSSTAVEDFRKEAELRSIPTEQLDGDEAREREPSLSGDVQAAVSVPEAVVDPFELTLSTAIGASDYGATIRTHTTVTDISTDGGTLDTVTVESEPRPTRRSENTGPTRAAATGKTVPGPGTPGGPGGSVDSTEATETTDESGPKTEEIDPDYVINATGPWAGEIAEFAGLEVELSYATGTMGVVDGPSVDTIVTAVDSEGMDTLVPFVGNALLGEVREPASGHESVEVATERMDALSERMSESVPEIETADRFRTFCGVHAWHPDAENEYVHTVIDHGDRDDCWGITTVVGGTLTTHRYVAERVVDDVVAKFGISRSCRTADIALPEPGTTWDEGGVPDRSPVLCESQSVTRAAVREALDGELRFETDLEEVRIRTKATMGECQGGRCGHRIAAELYPDFDESTVDRSLDQFLANRWDEQRQDLSGRQFERANQTYRFHVETMNRTAETPTFVPSKTAEVEEAMEDESGSVSNGTVGLAPFDDGRRNADESRQPWGERGR